MPSDQETKKQEHLRPYLLLDVRDAEEYNSGHIISAESYPKTLLSRGNYETKSLLSYVMFSCYNLTISLVNFIFALVEKPS